MDNVLKYALVVSVMTIIVSCDRNPDFENYIYGDWRIIVPDSDTLTFKTNDLFIRVYNDGIEHAFKYRFGTDSVTVQYRGPNKPIVQATSHRCFINQNEMVIDFSNGCYGFNSQEYKFLKLE